MYCRYPELYDFLLSELNDATKLILNNKRSIKLHPLLLLLNRLYPSPLDGTNCSIQLIKFLPILKICSSKSVEMKTRILGAKAFVTLQHTNNIIDNLFIIIEELQVSVHILYYD